MANVDKKSPARKSYRKIVALISSASLLSTWLSPMAVMAQAGPDSQPTVSVRKGPTAVKIFSPKLNLLDNPSDDDLASVRVFPEMLRPVKSTPISDPIENQKLKQAIVSFKSKNNPEDVSDLEAFIREFPNGRWTPAVQLNVGKLRFETGYFSEALSHYKSAWTTLKQKSDKSELASRVLSELMELSARLGKRDELSAYINEAKDRVLHGSTEEQIDNAKTGFKYMEVRPEDAYKCGPYALNTILREKGAVTGRHPVLEKAKSTHSGTNLVQLRNWAKECGLNYQIAKRSPGAPILMPSVVHWKVGHFGAVLGKYKERYHISDPTFDTEGNFWLSRKAIDTECDGYFLVEAGPLPVGWEPVSDTTGSMVWGKGQGKGRAQDEHTPPCPKCYKCGSGKGMATATAFKMLATLQIEDTPLEYSPPIGPNMDFTVTYNHLETNQPSTPAFTTFGPDWNFNWLSYLTLDASGNATVRVRGGGSEVFNYSAPNNITNPYKPNLLTQAILAITGKDEYQRQLPDGSIEVFDQPDGAGRFFMTKVIDPQGNTVGIQYNSNFRIETITDSIGQVTELDYLSNQITNVGYYKVKTISDPFSREANFAYDTNTLHIISITDVINIVSSFVYDSGSSFITSMSTPYGITSFQTYTPQSKVNHPNATPELARGIRFTYPDRTGMVVENWLNYEQCSYYWDRHALELYPGDPGSNIYSHCEQTQWQMIDGSTILESSVADWVKPPLESRITYMYEGQETHEELHFTGVSNKPISISRTVQGGTQSSSFAYNAFGQMTKSVDPLNRTMSYLYSANNVDLLEVRQTRVQTPGDLLGKWQYNNQHLPLVYIDGSARKTLYSYNPQGQILTLTDANAKVTTYGYTNNYLTSIDGPLTGDKDKTTITYDVYGRVFQVTDSVGYTVQYEYDLANRLTKTTYPDGTFESNFYDRLDLVASKDRIGRWTTSEYNSLDELVKTTDPLGRSTQYVWCSCGSLVSLTDGAGNKTVWHHDLEGRTVEKVYSNQTSYRYEYEDIETSGRLKRRIDALNQKTDYQYNLDDSLAGINYSDLAVAGSTSNVSMTWDQNYRRVSTVTNGWGTLTYSYNSYVTNPFGAATTGGGMLHTVSNNVIANSVIEYFYDELGRTSKREINGAANSISWVYDAMSRVTSETNALGTFNYTYVDQNASGGDRGTTRLAKIDYPSPNNQDTFFTYFGNSGDQRLQRISNQTSAGAIISQFDYQYDPAGQITQWQQFQNNNKLCYNLSYDKAGQLTQARAGAGSPLPPYAREYQYSYDSAANRTGVQTSSVDTLKLSGTKNTGDVFTVTVFDTALSGGQQAISYTATAPDTLTSVALNLATAINQNSSLQNLGVNASTQGASLKIRSVSKNITTYTTSTSGTATMQFTFTGNGVTNAIITGTKTTGDSITITVKDPTITSGPVSISYTVLSSDTLLTIANGLKTAINANSALSAAGITATSGVSGTNGVLSLKSTSSNVTNYSSSSSANATEVVTLSMPTNIPSSVSIASSIVRNDDIDLQIIDPGLPSGIQTVSYRVPTGGTPASVASAIAALINAQANLIAAQVTATVSSSVITLNSLSPNQTRYRINYEGGEWFNALPKYSSTQTVTIGGTGTAGDTITFNAYYNGGAPLSLTYTVASGATSTSIATALAAAINGNAAFQNSGITASSNSNVLYVSSSRINGVYTTSLNSGATETVKIGPQIGSTRSFYNNVNELLSQVSGGSAEVDWVLDLPPKSSQLNSNSIYFSSPQPNSTTYTGSAQLTFGPNVGGNSTAKLSLGSSDSFSITVHDSRLPSGSKTISVTRSNPSFTVGWVTQQFVQSILNDADLQALRINARNVANQYLETSIKFQGDAETTPSANTVEFNQLLSTPAPILDCGAQTNFAYDANGNMTSDGTNTYQWDAENRLIKVSFPGSGNFTDFLMDPAGRFARVTESEGGNSTWADVKWSGTDICEFSGVSPSQTRKFYSAGQINDTQQLFATRDHIASARELTNSAGTIQAIYQFDPAGQLSLESGSPSIENMLFCQMFLHRRSNLSMTLARPYSSRIGRWLARDPILSGTNLYSYAINDPISIFDETGFLPMTETPVFEQPLEKEIECICRRCYSTAGIQSKCISEGKNILKNLRNVYARDYRRYHLGGFSGQNCYDWSRRYKNQLSSGPPPTAWRYQREQSIDPYNFNRHHWLKIYIPCKPDNCAFYADNGYLGTGPFHSAPPVPPGWGPPVPYTP